MIIPPAELVAKNKALIEKDERKLVDAIIEDIAVFLEQRRVTGGKAEFRVHDYGDRHALEKALGEYGMAGYGVSFSGLLKQDASGDLVPSGWVMVTVTVPDPPTPPEPPAKRRWGLW